MYSIEDVTSTTVAKTRYFSDFLLLMAGEKKN